MFRCSPTICGWPSTRSSRRLKALIWLFSSRRMATRCSSDFKSTSLQGFCKYSNAPSRNAEIAVSVEPFPVSTIASTKGDISLALAMTSMPLSPGMSRSTIRQSKSSCSSAATAAKPSGQNRHGVSHAWQFGSNQFLQIDFVIGEEDLQRLGFRLRFL